MPVFDVSAPATFSVDGRYRYSLARWVQSELQVTVDYERQGGPKTCAFILLNPSTADTRVDDPTVRRCVSFAGREGFDRLLVGNLFALRSIDPSLLRMADDPIGPGNDEVLRQIVLASGLVVAAWGVGGTLDGRDAHVRRLMADLGVELMCLGQTIDGHPRHPLYVKRDTPVIPLVA